jgi:hypothetical protein
MICFTTMPGPGPFFCAAIPDRWLAAAPVEDGSRLEMILSSPEKRTGELAGHTKSDDLSGLTEMSGGKNNVHSR